MNIGIVAIDRKVKSKMALPIALQLYSVRKETEQDFAGVIRKVANMGYAGVETAAAAIPPGTTAADAAALFRSWDLRVVAAHSPLPLGNEKSEILDNVLALGTDSLICASLKKYTDLETLDGIKRGRDMLNEANEICKASKLTLGFHNHWYDYGKIDGRYVIDILRDGLAPEIVFEVDIYWVQTAGADPVEVIKTLGVRAPFLHIKDGPCTIEAPMVAVGEGKMDFPPIIQAARPNAKWLIVELDRCATDMLEAVEKSYKYLSKLE